MILHLGSNAQIKIKNNKLFKYYNTTNTNLYNQYHWLNEMSKYFPNLFPKVYDWKTNGYEMEYLKDYENLHNYINKNNFEIEILYEIINSIRRIEIQKQNIDFNVFINRISSHLNINNDIFNSINKIFVNDLPIIFIFNKEKFIKILYSKKEIFNKEYSNCHGDLTFENILIKDNNIKLIDSNFMFNFWNSWLLDIAKLCQSTHYDYEDIFYIKEHSCFEYEIINNHKIKINCFLENNNKFKYYNQIINKYSKYKEEIKILEICNYIRMLKYKQKISKDDYIKSFVILNLLWDEFLKEFKYE